MANFFHRDKRNDPNTPPGTPPFQSHRKKRYNIKGRKAPPPPNASKSRGYKPKKKPTGAQSFPLPVSEVPSVQLACRSKHYHGDPNSVEQIRLEDFSTVYVKSLPLRVQVTKGIYGDNEETTISTEDMYDVHFVRHREVVAVKDEHNGDEFSVPLNSTIRFGLLYNPNGSEQDALRGFNFPNISDILTMTPRPKLVCSINACGPKGFKDSLKAMEVLLIKETFFTDSRRKVMAYSFTDHCDKSLDVHTPGLFSTKPVYVKLPLSEILRFVPKPVPSSVVLYGTNEASRNLPTHLFSRVLQMRKNYTEVVLIVTNFPRGRDNAPFEIPTNVEVDIRVVPLSDTEQQELNANHQVLKRNMQHKSIRHYRHNNVSERDYQIQLEIYAAVQMPQESSNYTCTDYVEMTREPVDNYDEVSSRSQFRHLDKSVHKARVNKHLEPVFIDRGTGRFAISHDKVDSNPLEQLAPETEQVMTSDDCQNSPLLPKKPPSKESTQVKDELSRVLASRKETMELEQAMTSGDYKKKSPLLPKKPPRKEVKEPEQVKDELSQFLKMRALKPIPQTLPVKLEGRAERKKTFLASLDHMQMEKEQVQEEMTSGDDYQNSPLLLRRSPRKEPTEPEQIMTSGDDYQNSPLLLRKSPRKEPTELEQIMTSGDDYQNSPLLLRKSPRKEVKELEQVMTSGDDYQNSPFLLKKPPRKESTEPKQVKDELSRVLTTKAFRKVKPIPQTLPVKLTTSEGTAGENKVSSVIARLNKEVEQNQASINPRPIPQTYGLPSEGAAEGNKTFLASRDQKQMDTEQVKEESTNDDYYQNSRLLSIRTSRKVNPRTLPVKAVTSEFGREEENMAFLASLDHNQVLELLQCSGMSQYQGSFIREGITGDILLDCDEDILENELWVTSRLHRIKLMKFISGQHSAELYFKH